MRIGRTTTTTTTSTVTKGAPTRDTITDIRNSVDHLALSSVDLAKSYGERRVFSGISLDLERGEVVAVMGPSGSGKSTLLHCLGGLVRPDAGVVRVNGTEVSALEEPALTLFRRKHIGYVFQWHGLLPDLTARENVAVAAWANGSRKKVALQSAAVGLESLGLGPLCEAGASTLSGGEAQRVAIARALINHPLVILADEPTASLDREAKFVVLDLLRAAARSGCAVLVATHDAEVAEAADRVVGVG